MKAIVMSDSHGRAELMMKALSAEKDRKIVFFLGDGLSDIDYVTPKFPDREFICVSGNCDWGNYSFSADDTAYKHIEGTTIVCAHGHRFSVKTTLLPLLEHANGVMANAVLYGHTHKRDFHYDASYGLFVLNPGALCMGSYAKIEINKFGIEAEFRSAYD